MTEIVTIVASFGDGTSVTVERESVADALSVLTLACLPDYLTPEEPCSADDLETRAFIDGWNMRLRMPHIDKALHFWNRKRCGI